MSDKKDIHSFLENGGLPVLVVIAIPVAAILYANWTVWFQTQSPASTSASQVAQALPAAELSLDATPALPSSVAAGAFVPFSFTVKNTNRGTQYQYKVSVQWSTGESDVIDENVLSLAAGASQTVSENLKFEVANETVQVTISLPQTGQTIKFSIPNAK